LYKATNSRRVDVKRQAGKEERGGKATCGEFLGDGADEAVDLLETEHDVAVM
jgi:hypothetical protein